MRSPIKKRINKPKSCYFCKQEISPDYKDQENLKRFVTERGKITGRMYTGICQKHQRVLTKAVKHARYIALLPFIVRPS